MKRSEPPELPEEFKDLPPILDTKTIAKILRLTRAGAVKVIERGELPAFRVGKLWRVHREDFFKYMKLEGGEAATKNSGEN